MLWDRDELDRTDLAGLEGKLRQLTPAPAVVINCNAFNDVDGAEKRPDAAFALNPEYAGRLATVASLPT